MLITTDPFSLHQLKRPYSSTTREQRNRNPPDDEEIPVSFDDYARYWSCKRPKCSAKLAATVHRHQFGELTGVHYVSATWTGGKCDSTVSNVAHTSTTASNADTTTLTMHASDEYDDNTDLTALDASVTVDAATAADDRVAAADLDDDDESIVDNTVAIFGNEESDDASVTVGAETAADLRLFTMERPSIASPADYPIQGCQDSILVVNRRSVPLSAKRKARKRERRLLLQATARVSRLSAILAAERKARKQERHLRLEATATVKHSSERHSRKRRRRK